MKREQKNIDARPQKMMKGKMEPSTMPIVVWVVPIVVQVTRQTIEVPHMISPYERQLKEYRHEVPHMTSPQKETTKGVELGS